MPAENEVQVERGLTVEQAGEAFALVLEGVQALAVAVGKAIGNVFRTADVWGPILLDFVEREKYATALENAGWLPIDAIPLDLLRDHLGAAPERLNAALLDYFVAHWSNIESLLRRRYAESGLDAEAMATLDEALQAHGYGLYRMTCRGVFPEIERVARLRFYGPGHLRRITNLTELRDAIGNELGASDLGPVKWWGLKICRFISESCYADVSPHSPQQLPGLPNRHALAHGLFSFSTARESLNTLFIADFMFRAIASLEQARPSGEINAAQRM